MKKTNDQAEPTKVEAKKNSNYYRLLHYNTHHHSAPSIHVASSGKSVLKDQITEQQLLFPAVCVHDVYKSRVKRFSYMCCDIHVVIFAGQ